MMPTVILYGMEYSVYVRIVRLALAEKGVDYTLEHIDVFEPGLPDWYKELHPFGQMPAFRHGDIVIYEARAINQYIDETFDGPSLQPARPLGRARQNQIISVADNRLYRSLVWGIHIETVTRPAEGTPTDKAVVASAIESAGRALPAIENLFGDGPLTSGESVTLADLHLVPIFDYFLRSEPAAALMAERRRLATWWNTVKQRESVKATPFDEADGSLPPLVI